MEHDCNLCIRVTTKFHCSNRALGRSWSSSGIQRSVQAMGHFVSEKVRFPDLTGPVVFQHDESPVELKMTETFFLSLTLPKKHSPLYPPTVKLIY